MNQPIITFKKPSFTATRVTLFLWVFTFPGLLILSVRIFYEQFYLTWLQGPQMIGFRFVHTWGLIVPYAILSALFAHAWLAFCGILLAAKKLEKRALFIALLIVTVITLVPLYLPADWIQRCAKKLLGPPQNISEVCYAAENGDLDRLKGLIIAGARINGTCVNQKSPLMLASANGHVDVVRYLLDHGAEVNKKESDGETALSLALELSPNLDVVEVLMQSGADIDARDSLGRTPLMRATFANDSDRALYIISKGADVTIKSDEGETALGNAMKRGNQVLVEALKKAGATDQDSAGR
jgi:hypothetical protein